MSFDPRFVVSGTAERVADGICDWTGTEVAGFGIGDRILLPRRLIVGVARNDVGVVERIGVVEIPVQRPESRVAGQMTAVLVGRLELGAQWCRRNDRTQRHDDNGTERIGQAGSVVIEQSPGVTDVVLERLCAPPIARLDEVHPVGRARVGGVVDVVVRARADHSVCGDGADTRGEVQIQCVGRVHVPPEVGPALGRRLRYLGGQIMSGRREICQSAHPCYRVFERGDHLCVLRTPYGPPHRGFGIDERGGLFRRTQRVSNSVADV
ncbi:hypothetical protein [Nocardia abscessus]|uniref:hypothetical protein n=1 Tax=Nocardia abscessus TaxID=120957 RepID=UPI0024567F54|nr:hypothetical protein [Nocardia abscessus]